MVRHLIITLEVLKTSILFGWLMERALTFFCNIGRRVPDVVHLGNFYQIMHEWWGKFLFTLGFLLNLPIFHYGPLPLLKPAFESNMNSKKQTIAFETSIGSDRSSFRCIGPFLIWMQVFAFSLGWLFGAMAMAFKGKIVRN